MDGNKPLTDVELLSSEIEVEIRSKVPSIEGVSIIPHSSSFINNISKSERRKRIRRADPSVIAAIEDIRLQHRIGYVK